MPGSENNVFSWFDKTKGVLTLVFFGALLCARLEYTNDKNTLAVQTMFEKYVIQNESEKKLIQIQIAGLKGDHDVLLSRVKDLENFVKPEEPEPKDYRK